MSSRFGAADRPSSSTSEHLGHAGCVAVGSAETIRLIRRLEFQNAPIVSIGVGSAAYDPIPDRYVRVPLG